MHTWTFSARFANNTGWAMNYLFDECTTGVYTLKNSTDGQLTNFLFFFSFFMHFSSYTMCRQWKVYFTIVIRCQTMGRISVYANHPYKILGYLHLRLVNPLWNVSVIWKSVFLPFAAYSIFLHAVSAHRGFPSVYFNIHELIIRRLYIVIMYSVLIATLSVYDFLSDM